MRKVKLKMNEQYKYEVIKKCSEGKVNKKYCEVKLDITRRSVDRLLMNYHRFGKNAFIHENNNSVPIEAISAHLENDILSLYSNKYQGSNFSHFTQLLALRKNICISESAIRSLFKRNFLLPPKAWKRTKHAETSRLKVLSLSKAVSKKTRNRALFHLLDLEFAHPRRARCANIGELLQMDASLHLWYGSKKTLLAFIDDATGSITGLYMDHHETLNGYYNILYQTLCSHGIPLT